MKSCLEPFQGRWYSKKENEAVHVESYIDVNEELLFRAVQIHRGEGPYRVQQAMLSIEKAESEGGEWRLKLKIVRLIQDGRDRTPEWAGRILNARARRGDDSLTLAWPEPGRPEPPDFSKAETYLRRQAGR